VTFAFGAIWTSAEISAVSGCQSSVVLLLSLWLFMLRLTEA